MTLFKPSGKYYTTEEWTVPEKVPYYTDLGWHGREVIIPSDMRYSPDFRRIAGGAVLVDSQEPWGFPHLFPGTNEDANETIEPEWTT